MDLRPEPTVARRRPVGFRHLCSPDPSGVLEIDPMCLGVPGRVTSVTLDGDVRMGSVDFSGVARAVCLEYVPEAEVGDYVLVHVGFALTRIDEAEARKVFELLAAMPSLGEDPA